MAYISIFWKLGFLKFPFLDIFDGLHKQVMWPPEKVKLMGSKFPKKEIFDGLHKQFFDDENVKFPFMEIPKKEILMAYISIFLMMKM